MNQHGAYRDGLAALFAARDAILTRRIAEARDLGSGFRRVYARRLARIVAGTVGTATAAAMAVGALFGIGTAALVAGSVITFASWAIVRPFAGIGLGRALEEWLRVGEDPAEDLERLERESVAEVAARTVASLARPSVVLPLAAYMLLVPLASHLAVWLGILWLQPAGVGWDDVRAFDNWIRASILVVGHSHLMLVYFAARFARTAEGSEIPVGNIASQAGWAAYGRMTAWSPAISLAAALVLSPVFPFGLIGPLFVLVIVAMTGIFVPLVFRSLGNALDKERLLQS